jgi:hypothetical protein
MQKHLLIYLLFFFFFFNYAKWSQKQNHGGQRKAKAVVDKFSFHEALHTSEAKKTSYHLSNICCGKKTS